MFPTPGEGYPFTGLHQLTEVGEWEIRKGPSLEQRRNSLGIKGEEDFEIFAIGQGLRRSAAGSEWQRGFMDHETAARGSGQPGEILR